VFDCCRIGRQQIAHRERNLVCTIVLFECSMLAFTWRHWRNFTLKSGSDQWRRQDLVSGGTTIEAPKARASRRQRRRVGWDMGRGVRSPAEADPRPLSHFLHILGHRTLLVARKIRFSCPKYKFHFEKMAVTVTTTFKSGGDKSPSLHTKLRLCLAITLDVKN